MHDVTQDPTLPEPGRRGLNRERTTRDLTRAAYELLRDEGFEAVTADAVAARAGVSRRTFFNYFPRVELVLRASITSTLAGLVDGFLERPEGESLHDSLFAVLAEPFPDAVLEQTIVMFGQARTSAAVRAHILEAQDEQVTTIVVALQKRLGDDTDPLRLEVLARAVIGTGHAACAAWVDRCGGVVDDDTRALQLRLLRSAFEALFDTFTLDRAVRAQED